MNEKELYSLFVTIGPVESCRVMKDYKVCYFLFIFICIIILYYYLYYIFIYFYLCYVLVVFFCVKKIKISVTVIGRLIFFYSNRLVTVMDSVLSTMPRLKTPRKR